MLELEYKCLLTLEQYQRIRNTLEADLGAKTEVQINYYYDSEHFILDQKDITLRIRQKQGALQMQLKQPIDKVGMLTTKNEFNQDISRFSLSLCMKEIGIGQPLPYEGDVFLLGSLVTERTKGHLNEFITIDLDKSYYLGVVDYELEVEFLEGHKEEALVFLQKLIQGEMLQNDVGGKRNRFFSCFLQINQHSQINEIG